MSTNPTQHENTVNPPIKKDWPYDRLLKVGPSKSFTDLSPKNVRNIIFDVSDEDDGNEMAIEPLSNKVGVIAGNNTQFSPNDGKSNKQETSSQRKGRATRSKVSKSEVPKQSESKVLGKKLFQTPSSNSNGKGSKRAKANNADTNAETESTKSPELNHDANGERTIKTPSSNILPKTMLSRFRPSTDMKLTEREVHVAAYIFSYDGDEDEILLKISDLVGRRKDFVTLCPDRLVNDKIMTLATVKGSWTQARKTNKTVWYLPPAFTDDALGGSTTDDLISKYARVWMQPYAELKYCEALTNIMNSEACPEDFLHSGVQLDMWELFVARNVTNGGTMENSSIWLLDWMEKESAFHTNLIPLINERHIRMRCALNLVCGEHNEINQLVDDQAQTFWTTHMKAGRTTHLLENSSSMNSTTNGGSSDEDNLIGVPFMATWLPYRDPVGNGFNVGIEVRGSRHCFTKGLPQMRAFYHVHYPVVMWYKYLGNAKFSFKLWPTDGHEQIDYPNHALNNAAHNVGSNNSRTVDDIDNKHVQGEGVQEEGVQGEADEIMGVQGEDLWMTTLTQAQLEGRRGVVIPLRVVNNHFHHKPHEFQVRLPNDQLKTWGIIWSNRIPTECKIGQGWSEFCSTHGLRKGDQIRFWKLDGESSVRIVLTRSLS
ncbi:DNA-binding barrel domain superfamily [Sesbania bispinosa]|nr:DNA-binding barrel domain superfamily [Sesbania bispinosa]